MNRKSEKEIRHVIDAYGNQLYRMAYVLLGNPHDVQDVLQEVMIRYMEKAPLFRDCEHERAWLIKVTSNLCRDYLRFCRRHTYVNLELLENVYPAPETREVLAEIISLPLKWKSVFLLHYVEGYKISEIAQLTGLTESAVKKRLQRGKEALMKNIREQN